MEDNNLNNVPQQPNTITPESTPIIPVTTSPVTTSPVTTSPVTTSPVTTPFPVEEIPKYPRSIALFKPTILFVAGVLLLLLIFIGVSFLFKSNKDNTSNSKSIFSGVQSEEQKLSSSIEIDTDQDQLPDFLEIGAGLDPNTSEMDRCEVSGCLKSDKSTASTQNTLIILDASGSMKSNLGSTSKMNMAKEAITNFVSTISTSETVGIMIYGHEGSNSTSDKAKSCASAELIAPLGSVSSSSVSNYLSSVAPVGWTPIGLAIQRGIAAFSGKEGQRNQIIIVSDGLETCDTDPISKAALALSSPQKIQVSVIGFAVAAEEQDSLSAISKSGGGSFMTANSSSELEAQFEAGHKNVEKFQADATCLANTSSESVKCLQAVEDKSWAYLDPLISDSISKEGKIFSIYSELRTSISKTYGDKIDEILNSASDQMNERSNTLLGQ